MQLSESELYARSACLMDADSGRVLYSKNSEQKLPMASTTKIMTCILALEDGRMDDLVTVSAYAASQPKVHMGAKTGEQFYLQDLLYALMLNSDNDAAVMEEVFYHPTDIGYEKQAGERLRHLREREE